MDRRAGEGRENMGRRHRLVGPGTEHIHLIGRDHGADKLEVSSCGLGRKVSEQGRGWFKKVTHETSALALGDKGLEWRHCLSASAAFHTPHPLIKL